MHKDYIKNGRNGAMLPIYAVTVGMDHKQENIVRPIGSVFHHLLFIQDGEGIFETATEKYVLKKDSIIFIKKNVPISYRGNTENFKTAWVTFDGSCVDELLRCFSAEAFSFYESGSFFFQLLSCIKLCANDASVEHISKAVYDLVVSYFYELNKARCPSSLAVAKSFISQNYAKDISVADIALAAEISPSLLFRMFKRNEGCTPIEYLRTLRIENAKSLLVDTACVSIRDIGETCGFSDTSYFCKVFKAQTGMSPLTFRETYKI